MRTFLLGVLLYIVGLMLCVSLLFAQQQEARMSLGVIGGSVPVAGGGPDVWYYTTAETDTGYTTGSNTVNPDTYLLRAKLTATVGGSLTKVAAKLGVYSAGSNWICQVYNSSKVLIAGANGSVAITNNVGTWFEMTLATPYTIANGEVVYVALGDSLTGGSQVGFAASGEDDRYNVTWGSPPIFPNPITDGSINYADLGIKIYVD